MKKDKILSATVQVTVITFGIKVLGLVKQAVIAACCGATLETDAFFIATGIIVSLCTVIFSAIAISLLSMYTEILFKQGREKSNQLINAVMRVFIPIAFGISCIFFVAAPVAARFFAPAFAKEQLEILTHYIRIMSFSFVLWCYFLIINVVLETEKRFLPGKGQGLFQNIFLILGGLFLYPKYGMEVMVYAFLLSALSECILVTWCARKYLKPIIGKIRCSNEVKKLMHLAIPLLLGNAMYEINDIVDKQISSGLGVGRTSILSYGATINDMVTGVIVISVSTVLFSHFASWVIEGKMEQVEKNIYNVLEYLTLILLPIVAMCIVAGDQLVAIFYGRGSFGKEEILLTYTVVIGYAVGFVFQAARANLIKVFYAFQDTRIPMINGSIAIGINIVLSIVLSRYFNVGGIALATSIAMLFVTLMLLRSIKKYLPLFSIKKRTKEFVKGMGATLVATILGIIIKRYMSILDNLYLSFCIEGMGVLTSYIIMLTILKSEAIRMIGRTLKR